MIASWLVLPVPVMLASLMLLFGTIAALLVLLCFGRRTGPSVRSIRGIVAPFVGTVAVIFAILLGFLANDIWDRERRAAAAVRTEADSLISLTVLAATFDLPREPLVGAVRSYAETVVAKEWPSMAHQNAAPETELALDRLLKTIARLDLTGAGNGDLRRLLLDSGLAVRSARDLRLSLSRDASEDVKWLLVLTLAVTSQIAVALVHLEAKRPQIAALTLWTLSLIFVIGLLATHEEPFAPPLAVAPDPIIHVVDVLGRETASPKE